MATGGVWWQKSLNDLKCFSPDVYSYHPPWPEAKQPVMLFKLVAYSSKSELIYDDGITRRKTCD